MRKILAIIAALITGGIGIAAVSLAPLAAEARLNDCTREAQVSMVYAPTNRRR
jgi:acyl-CoA synthetase (AMP-forming)/AMP-acid ligase II